ncbi:UNVERIFIED_CONTAM: hypothetical protein K2H54_046884 [Gekko kuhli]
MCRTRTLCGASLLLSFLAIQVSFRFPGAEALASPGSGPGLRRQKREWAMLPVVYAENDRGPFPKKVVQLTSNQDKQTTVYYRITGQGADAPPAGTFTVDRETGWLQVTRPLDRENIDRYMVLVHTVSASGEPIEEPMELWIKVSDLNDNRPQFTQPVFRAAVPEGAPPGTTVVQVSATDADDAVNTYNGVVSYSILSQAPPEPHPQMFTINRDTGTISVASSGLDREKVPVYTLTLQAADMEGEGLTTTARAVITVGDVKDNPPIPPTATTPGQEGTPHPALTVHALNVLTGLPASGLAMRFFQLEDPHRPWNPISQSTTNRSGRLGQTDAMPRRLEPGTYKLRFETGAYWREQGHSSFFPYVEVVFTVTEAEQKVHIPLLLSPYSYTTYRGN